MRLDFAYLLWDNNYMAFGSLTFDAYRALGDGVYSFSTLYIYTGSNVWRADTLSTTNVCVLRDFGFIPKPIVDCDENGKFFEDPDSLLKFLIEEMGFRLLIANVQEHGRLD